ncbi:glycosyltransferase family 4 protein [Hymenobacter sp. BT559]|uniref:glycosyltransferase family 4 protein n=1 Tax=Hymenobacter sp. BT559 TaxID=2795729 RepID=UPI0018ECCAEE|nr:glycosyltransferase family 4 protein [Hymenobacter sp. BT559]MBJ6142664.1 glycosyltransferase family 4 protein [Hymenobacter sp. BT559]
MHILQLCPRVPYPPHDGGALAMYETARGLAEAGHRVTILAANTPKHHQPADALAHLGPNVRLVAVAVDTRIRPLAALQNLLFSHEAYNVERFISQRLLAKLLELVLAEHVDVVQFEGAFVAWYAGQLNQALSARKLHASQQPKFVLRAHNVEYTIWEMLASRAGNALKKWYLQKLAQRLKAFEKEMLHRIDAVAAITEEDATRLRSMFYAGLPAPVSAETMASQQYGPRFAIIPASYDLGRLPAAPAPPKPRTLFIIGSLNWLPNLEGLAWFLKEVWPQAHAELPKLELHIAGSHPPADLTSRPPGQDNIFVHGFVESAPAFMQQYELMLVPLLSGGGMRVKVVEGLALGKAVLSTTLGAEGIAAHNDENILLRDGAAAWLAALRDYYHGRLPLTAIGEAAARTAHAEYDTRQVTQRLLGLYETLLGQPAPVPQP